MKKNGKSHLKRRDQKRAVRNRRCRNKFPICEWNSFPDLPDNFTLSIYDEEHDCIIPLVTVERID